MSVERKLDDIQSELSGVHSTVNDIKSKVAQIFFGVYSSHTGSTSKTRHGLYVMAFLAMAGSIRACNAVDEINNIKRDVTAIRESSQPQTANVIGNPEAETFYILPNGDRAYVKIDGKNVEDIVGGR